MRGTLKYLLLSLLFTTIAAFFLLKEQTFWLWVGFIFFALITIIYLFKITFPNAKYLKNINTNDNIDKRSFDEVYKDVGVFEYLVDGFKIKRDQGVQAIKWSEVDTIFGYKVDNYATDSICIDVLCNNDKSFRITEETLGWFQFLEHLRKALPLTSITWNIEITSPPFDTNLTLVYSKDKLTLEESVNKWYKD
jgi:hypothetical protein